MTENKITVEVSADKKLHELLVQKMKEELRNLPPGSLCQKTIRGKKYLYHYTYNGENPTGKKERQVYLSKKNDSLKRSLQRKAFIEKALIVLEKNISTTNEFLSNYRPFNPKAIIEDMSKAADDFSLESNIENFNEIKSFDTDILLPFSSESNTFYSEKLIHNTPKGMKVRSKSESIIAMLLDMNQIPYHYETSLEVGEHTFYPDFTVIRPSDQKIFYWEHFGMMDDTCYHEQMKKKLLTYISCGIVPWDQLITTFESNENTFDSQYINKFIQILLL